MRCDTPEVAVGGRLSIRVVIANGANVGSVPFHVLFNPAILRFEGGQEGSFLGGDGRQTAFFASATSTGDTVVVGLSRLGGGEGMTGGGELCVLSFTAVASGPSGLQFASAKVRDGANRIAPSVFGAVPVQVR